MLCTGKEIEAGQVHLAGNVQRVQCVEDQQERALHQNAPAVPAPDGVFASQHKHQIKSDGNVNKIERGVQPQEAPQVLCLSSWRARAARCGAPARQRNHGVNGAPSHGLHRECLLQVAAARQQ